MASSVGVPVVNDEAVLYQHLRLLMSDALYVPPVVTVRPVRFAVAVVTARLYCCNTTFVVPGPGVPAEGLVLVMAIEGTALLETVMSSRFISCLAPVADPLR